MAKWIKWSPLQKQIYDNWLAERPAAIREMSEQYALSPDELFLLKTTGQRVVLNSLNENGTVTVTVLPEYNRHKVVAVPFSVFGINPADLEPCELPELVTQVVMDDAEVEALGKIDKILDS